MHIDANDLEANTIIEGDLCIVGAGAAGLSIALEWLNMPQTVILLESGGFEFDMQVQELNSGETTGQRYYPLQSSRLRFFGGTTGHWQGMCSPMDPVNFVKRAFVPHSGWPISREDLDPFYTRACQTIQLESPHFEFEYWRKELPEMIPFPLDSSVIWNKMWQKNPLRFGTEYKDEMIEAANIHLYTHATVVNIEVNEDLNSVTELDVRDLSGKPIKVRAGQVILACGAIQNARLLLASNTQAPNGLGNDHDNVGRYFMEHFEMICSELWLFKPFKTNLYDRGAVKAELAITEQAQIENGILNGTAALRPLEVYKHIDLPMESWQDDDPRRAMENLKKSSWLTKLFRLKSKIIEPESYYLETRMEQAPNPDSRVTLGREKDALGMPKANLNWALSALDKYSLRKIQEIFGVQMAAAGMGRVKLKEFLLDEDDTAFQENANAGWHHMGTTRMADDPKLGVVDRNCKVHGLSNLYVAGSGCFSTGGAPNPTLSIVALSIRLSDHVKQQIRNATGA